MSLQMATGCETSTADLTLVWFGFCNARGLGRAFGRHDFVLLLLLSGDRWIRRE